jgi:hypothetical protein
VVATCEGGFVRHPERGMIMSAITQDADENRAWLGGNRSSTHPAVSTIGRLHAASGEIVTLIPVTEVGGLSRLSLHVRRDNIAAHRDQPEVREHFLLGRPCVR